MKDEYKKQKRVPEEIAEYGIKRYTKLQKEFHTDIMKLMTTKKYKDLPADDCMVVFGRVYSIYIASQIKKEKRKEDKTRKEFREFIRERCSDFLNFETPTTLEGEYFEGFYIELEDIIDILKQKGDENRT